MIKIVSVLLALVLSGCAATHGTVVMPEQLSSFKEGVTTESEVILALGKPIGVTANSNGTKTLIYSSMQLSFGYSDMKSNSTIFEFGVDGRMISYQSSEVEYGKFRLQ